MSIRPRGKRFEVDVAVATALPGYKRIRRSVDTEELAEQLHTEITQALEVYGKWPVKDSDQPLPSKTPSNKKGKSGTLRFITEIALQYRWKGTDWGKIVEKSIYPVVDWFELRGCADLDDINTEHVEKFTDWRRALGNSNATINKYYSMLSVLNDMALERKPPLAKHKIGFKHLPVKRVEKWWLRPEQLDELTKWLTLNGEELFSDYITIICFQGFRPAEALRLQERLLIDLEGEEPRIQVAGTKTKKSGNTIPVFDMAVPIFKRCVERARKHDWKQLFPFSSRQARDLWNDCRRHLGVDDVSSSTLRALRRTFGAYATARGMPTKTLQEVYRHESITTTEGYLDLIGNGRVEDARKYMKMPEVKPQVASISAELKDIIIAYKETGASPQEVAAFAKELMK